MTLTPLLRKVAAHLQEHDAIPLFGNSSPLDWDALSKALGSRFGVSFSLKPKTATWRIASELKAGLGEELMTLPIHLSPLEGNAFWMMSRESVAKFTAWMLSGKSDTPPVSEILTEGFYRFLALQALDTLSSLEPFTNFSLSLSEESAPDTDAFCIDVAFTFERKSCWGRLAIPPGLRKHWAEHFSRLDISVMSMPGLELRLGIQVGRCSLKMEEWETAAVGDVVMLDRGSYDPHHHKGSAYLTLGDRPLLEVKIHHNKLQILGAEFTHEETMSQSEENPVSLRDLPMNVVVELAQLKMPLSKLLELAPGNMLELPIDPEQSVRLTVNGELIGRAELVQIGKGVGIRILEK